MLYKNDVPLLCVQGHKSSHKSEDKFTINQYKVNSENIVLNPKDGIFATICDENEENTLSQRIV